MSPSRSLVARIAPSARAAILALGAAGLAVSACSSSVLIRQDDATFARSQQRLERATERVEALTAPAGERAVFLQAEAFHRYRFTPPARGALSYVAEVAAAVTDFPAFQSLAGSLDLLDLRLRADDAAVQLWETLLSNHPQTTLRPLALYRLGWAYRNAGASGLPRASGDEAFDALAAESPGTALAALALAAKAEPAKSKGTAAGWSVVPGLGQFYLGETLGGSIRLGIALSSLAAITVPLYVAYRRRTELTWSGDWPLLVTGVGGLIVLSIDYTSSYEDAMRGVVQFNEKAEAAFDDVHPEAP